jgi:alpha-aminoadipate/glutamate carrier protein LysW
MSEHKMNCLECYGEIGVPNDAIDGELVTCNECGSSFELAIGESGVVNLKPAETVGEDWGE